MNTPKAYRLATCLLTAAVVLPAGAQTASLAQCQQLRERIDHYTDLRRKGGNASAMARWKKKLRGYEADFRRFDCIDYGSELRQRAKPVAAQIEESTGLITPIAPRPRTWV